MRFHTTVALALSATSTVVAQGTNALPKCSQKCVGNSLAQASGCKQSDIACICRNKSYISGLACCVSKECTNPADVQATVAFATNICKVAGVTDLPREASCDGEGGASSSSAYVQVLPFPQVPLPPGQPRRLEFPSPPSASNTVVSAATSTIPSFAIQPGDFESVPLVDLPGTKYTPPPLATTSVITAPASDASALPTTGGIITDSDVAPSRSQADASSTSSPASSAASASPLSMDASMTASASGNDASPTADEASAQSSEATEPNAGPAGRLQVQGLLTAVFSALGVGLGIVAFFL